MKIKSELILIVTGIVLMLVSNSVISTYAAASNSGQINWGELCRMADPLIVEPCNTLTSPDGYTLTEEGNRVFLVCVGLGTATSLIDQLQILTPLILKIAKCGGSNAQSDDISNVSNLLANFLGPNYASSSTDSNVTQKSSQPDLAVPPYNHDNNYDNNYSEAELDNIYKNGLKVEIKLVAKSNPSEYHDVAISANDGDNSYTPVSATFPFGDNIRDTGSNTITYTYYYLPGVISVGESFNICVKNLDSGHTSCETGINHGEHKPEQITIALPGSPVSIPDISSSAISIVSGASAPASGLGFEPASITVSVGTPLTWRNDDTTLHTVTSGSTEGGDSGKVFDSSYLAAGKTFQHKIDTAGTYGYYCTLHPYMTGRVIVQ